MEREELVAQLVNHEWELFQHVDNIGGRARCQDMPRTFEIMRRAQYSAWTDEMLASWLDDLDAWERAGLNPVTLKYAHMMRSTHPDEYEQIRGELPAVDAHAAELVEQIIALQLTWAEELAQRWPHVASRGRVLRTADDAPDRTSQETYARGELLTYSVRTLELMLTHFERAAEQGRNLQEEIVAHEARAYGHASLGELEEALAHE